MIQYHVNSQKGYTDKIGELVFMMEHVRAVTKDEIKQFKSKELDYLVQKNDNSIGALLLHIASIEKVHQLISFENRDFNDKELSKWSTALNLAENARQEIKNNSILYYFHELDQIRNETLNELKDD